ncbi:hypothetical protein GCM10017620_17490 [Brevundimonas intermedia]|uniref:Uncharacterized protein n=1 Tax=Brevundimonas intermedia TaxID=74315 RepID=A0ABQ5TAE4_9CAUL|nr:hypothetical protein [Brevundimonas intermedia]GLK48776.1 hypothetical protein GCM10017620_17490 [Brevundimonas intermedia]
MAGPIHYEVYIRRTVPASWSLLIATEDRKHALETAEDQLSNRLAAAARVTKETLDPDTMEFNSLTILTIGAPEEKKKPKPTEAARPACSAPAELYTPHARALIARVLEDWLKRQGVTAFELLHRPDLAERLDASGVELQHAVQKVAVPESQASGQDLHAVVRHYQRLAEESVARLIKAGRAGLFPSLKNQSIADLAHRLIATQDRTFVMGGVIAHGLADRKGARERLDCLMDMVAAAPPDGQPRALVLGAVEQIASEMLAVRSNLAEILGPSLDHGASLAAVVRMIAPREVERLIGLDPRMALMTPVVEGPAARLGQGLADGYFPKLSTSLARMVTRELASQRRLRANDPVGEIDILRTLAMALTAAAGRLLTLEEVQNAFVDRSKSLVTPDFVAAYVSQCKTVLSEAEYLTRLCENVTGGANKRAAARWLSACVTSLRLENEMRQTTPGGPSVSQKLLVLARLQRSVRAVQLGDIDEREISTAIGVLGGTLEADAGLLSQIGRAQATPVQKLTALMKMITGETAPLGPAADRARSEAIKMLRLPEIRDATAGEAALQAMMQAAGLKI